MLLCRAIYAQQISSKVAKVLFGRFCERFENSRPTPEAVGALLSRADADLAGCGLSRQKRGIWSIWRSIFRTTAFPTVASEA